MSINLSDLLFRESTRAGRARAFTPVPGSRTAQASVSPVRISAVQFRQQNPDVIVHSRFQFFRQMHSRRDGRRLDAEDHDIVRALAQPSGKGQRRKQVAVVGAAGRCNPGGPNLVGRKSLAARPRAPA